MRILISIIIFLLSQNGRAQGGSQNSMHEKGPISLSLLAGTLESRLLNQDATYSSLSGWHAGMALEVTAYTSGTGQLRLFGSFDLSELKDKLNESVTAKKNETPYGAKAYVSPWLYLGAGYGQSEQKFEAGTTSVTTKNSLLATGLGTELTISPNWSIGLQGWYKMNPLPKQSDTDGNSFSDGYDLSLVLTWSPRPTTIIRFTR